MTHNTNIPTGEDYLVKIVAITKTHVKKECFASILTYEVSDGPHRGQQIVDYLNFNHKSEFARKIAYVKAFNICHAVGLARGLLTPALPDSIVGKFMIIHMDMEQGLNTVSRSGYRPTCSYRNSGKLDAPIEKPTEELVIEFTAPTQTEYMVIRRRGNSRRVNFAPNDTEKDRQMKIDMAIRELDYAVKGGN